MQKESMDLPTKQGMFRLTVWHGERGRELIAMSTPNLDLNSEIMLRIHSECMTGDTFGSLLCDCGEQLQRAIREIQRFGNGILIYHRQEGRNTGLLNKVRIYNLMQSGFDTYEASKKITGSADARDYSDTLTALNDLLHGRKCRVRLLSTNPDKRLFLEKHGYTVIAQSLPRFQNKYNAKYLHAQVKRFSETQ